MSDLVRACLGSVEKSVSRGLAERHDLKILDESAYRPDGRIRPTTRVGGRPKKPKTSVAESAAKKKAASRGASTPEEAQK
jgi:hypothetical protein